MNDPLLEVAERELLELVDRGETPRWDEFASRYPEDLDSLRQIYDRLLNAETQDFQPAPQAAETDDAADLDTCSLNSGPGNESTVDATASSAGTSSQPSVANRLPRQFGAYELLDELARGGMGVVFRARQVKLNRIVALKMILSGELAGEEQVRRFYVEAEAAAALDHPGIVPVIEVGQHEGQHFFSMGMVDGASLAATIRDQSLSQRDGVRLLQQITDAVAYAHGQGVIHRDLKPANVLIDSSGQPRVTDFGLAKRVSGDSGMTATGQIMGTPSYMPPEQASGRIDEIGVTADVYSLGAILYEMLVGRPPFRGTTAIETLRQVIESDLVHPSRLNNAVDRDLETICLKCLAKDPDERYPTAAALSAELQRYLDGSPIEARRIGIVPRAYRWCRRRPLQTGLVAAALMLVGLFGALLTANRRAETVTQVSQLKSSFNSQLRVANTSADTITGLEAIVASLKTLDPTEADLADQKLTEEIVGRIESDLRTNKISDDGEGFRTAIDWVRKRDSKAAQRLDASFLARLSDWRTLIHLEAPHSVEQAKQALGLPLLEIADGAISRPASKSAQVTFGEACPGTAEIIATFADGWEGTGEIGVLLNANEDRGYTFVLRSSSQNSQDARQRSADREDLQTDDMIVEVRKAGRVLQQARLPKSSLTGGAVSLRARRERSQLSLQVNNNPPVEIRDVFATSAGKNGRFGLLWPASVKLTSLRTRSRDLPAQPRPIDEADVLFDNQNFAAALELYDRLARESKSVEMQSEANYKAAVCLVELKRPSEATPRLEQVWAGRVDPWGLLASCQLWLINIRNGALAEADAIQDQLAAVESFEQLAAAVPSSQRDEIIASVFSRRLTAESPAELVQLERAMALDRLLSIDGRGDSLRQIACVKTIEKAGRVQLAHQLLLKLRDAFPLELHPHYRLSMLARSNGNFDEALKCADRGIEVVKNHKNVMEGRGLMLERIRTLTAMGNIHQAMLESDELEDAIRSEAGSQAESHGSRAVVWETLSQLALIRGFIEDDRGDAERAVEIWRKGYFDTRQAIGAVDASSGWIIPNVLILGSLSNELKPADATGLVVALSGNALPQQLVRMGVRQFGEDIPHQTLLKMWQRPDAKQIARDGYALHILSYQDRWNKPITLAGRELVQQTAFSDDLTGNQKEVIELAVSDLLSLLKSKTIGMMDFVGFGIAWKTPGDDGKAFEPLVSRLPDRAKSLAAYIIAHRLATTNGKTEAILRWMELAAIGLGDNQIAATQIRDELAEIGMGQGVLKIVNPLEREIKIEWTGPDGEAVVQELHETRTWNLPAGSYAVRTLDGSGATLSSEQVSIRPLMPQSLSIESRWTPGTDESTWPGPIVRPARLPGIRKWQLSSREPLTDLRWVSGSPDGQLLAVAGRDGLVRIYRVSDNQLIHILPGHSDMVTSLSWSADGKFLLTTAYDFSVQIWQIPKTRLVHSFTLASSFRTAALSPDGQQVATGSWSGKIRIYECSGEPIEEYDAHSGPVEIVKWSSDGSMLLSSNQKGQLLVRRLADAATLLDRQYDSLVDFSFSPDQSQLAVTQEQSGSVDFIDTKTWQTTRTFDTKLSGIRASKWTGRGNELALVMMSGEIVICDPEDSSGEPRYRTSPHRAYEMTRVGTDRLAVLSDHDDVKIWNATLTESHVLLSGKNRGVSAIRWHPSDNLVAVGFGDGSLSFLDASGKQVVRLSHGSVIQSLAWSGDGQRLAVSLGNGEVLVYLDNLTTKHALPRHRWGAEVIWTTDGKLLTGNGDGELREYVDLKQPYRVLSKIRGRFKSLVDYDASTLLYTSDNTRFNCMSLTEPDNVISNDRKQMVYSVAVDDTSGLIAVGVRSNIEFFDAARLMDGELEPMDTWELGVGHFHELAWNSSGESLYALCNDGRLLHLDREGQNLATLPLRDQISPYSFAVSSDDSLVVTGTSSPFATFHDMEKARASFSVVPLEDGRTLKFFPGGYCADSLEGLDEEFVCVTLDDDGIVEMHQPSDFFNY
ncbi:protein kinase domain-containing protein [Rosistilla oblonga]|uniref:protein kinase domain-containing protein n=1 Tax=Rosistilla oblonga TaxID=2527990 RepID=UPI003A9762A2